MLAVEALGKFEGVPLVQCQNHKLKTELSASIIRYLLIMHMHFACKRWNKVTKEQKKKKKDFKTKRAHQT
jgi:hypothetical protein